MNKTTEDNRARLLDLAKGGTGTLQITRYTLAGKDKDAEAVDYNGPILTTLEERRKFEDAVARYCAAQGEQYDGRFMEFKYSHRTKEEAIADAREEYKTRPCLIRHADGLYYMHNEDAPGRPTIIDVLIDEILQ